MTSISERGYGISKDTLSPSDLAEIKAELTVVPYVNQTQQQLGPPPNPIELYMESSKKLYVPKCYGLQRFGAPDETKLKPPIPLTLAFNGTLRPEQKDPVENYLKAARDPLKTGGIINLACGAGKTVIGLYILAQLNVKTMIIVHKDFLLDQWRERINAFIPAARVGLIKAKVIDTVDKDVVIASLQSLSMKEYAPNTFDGIGFLIVDEVHRTATEVFSQALKKLNVQYTLGLSATVNRKDGLSKVFKWYIGDIIHKARRKKQEVIIDIVRYHSTDRSYCREETFGYNRLNFAKMISNICEYAPRTNMIVDKIKHYITTSSPRRKVLVLSERKNHLAAIKYRLNEIDPTITTGFYIGGMKPMDLQQSQTKDVILASYAFASEGFDAKELDTLILATPKTDIEQSVGRILRAAEGDRKNIPTVVDIVDTFSIYERQADKRLKFYKTCGFSIQDQSARNRLSLASHAFLPDDDETAK